ncbi:hypothetical protein [Granulicella sp. L46]|uniref:hypothetical protein n=1 Tax=Granulicella sp. L46 TaxID=1641865 RepID=UPI00131DFFC5|nr:hypothetical protein [Granulicella sp. L46]
MTTNITRTPSPGDGHDYIHDLDETVNPANGALSVRIAVHPPQERGFNHPMYAFMYDSDEEHTVNMWQQMTICPPETGYSVETFQYGPPMCVANVGQPILWDTNNLNYATGGSTDSVNTGPNTLTYQRQRTFTYPVTDVEDTACQVNTGFVYEDDEGRKHNLFLLNIMSVLNNALAMDGQASCATYYGIQPLLTGGDAQYKAVTAGVVPAETLPGDPGPFSALVADVYGNGIGGDANGNSPRGTGRPGYAPGDGTAMPGSSGFAPSVGTHQITFPGYSIPYTYTVANQSMTYRIGYTDITSVGETLCGGKYNTNSANVQTWTTSNGSTTMYAKYTGIELPDGLYYTFTYDPAYGLIDKITYPTGASVTYTWGTNVNAESMGFGNAFGAMPGTVEPVAGTGPWFWNNGPPTANSTFCNFHHDFPAITKRVVSYDGVNPATEQDFSYSTTWTNQNDFQWATKQTTVTTIDLLRPGHPSFKTVYNYNFGVNFPVTLGHITTSGVPQEGTIIYYDTSGSVLKTIVKVWSGPYAEAHLAGECTVLPNGLVSGAFYSYQTYPSDYAQSGTSPYLSQTDVKNDIAEFDYGVVNSTCTRPSTTPSRETVMTYAAFGPTPSLPVYSVTQSGSYSDSLPSMWGKPATVKTYDHGSLVAETDYAYDQFAVASVSPAPLNHDEASYGSSSTVSRGNPTTITKKCFTSSQTCANSVTQVSYDTTGQPVTVTDANLNQTMLSYADNYTGDDGSPSGNTNTYLTKITRPTTNNVQHVSSYQYDFNKGELRKATDENGQSSSYSYGNDPWNRLMLASFPDGGQMTYSYNDAGPKPTIQTTQLLSSTVTKGGTTVMDGVGHIIMTEVTSDPDQPDYISTVYDGMGLPYTVSNPYRSTSDPTYGLTTFTYDALGRQTSLAHPGTGTFTTSYSSNVTTSTDELGNQWQRTFDSFGRLTKVLEPNGSAHAPSMETDYGYNALNDLTAVTQWGGITGSSGVRTRAFSYDSLSRLLASSNPETGTVNYTYDPNGNLTLKTDARGVKIAYSYDALNRPLGRTYSSDAAATPSSCYQYDLAAASNGVGRLWKQWTQSALSGACPASAPGSGFYTMRSVTAYDSMGRLLNEQQSTFASQASGKVYAPAYTYDLAGDLLTSSDGTTPSPTSVPTAMVTFTNNYDSAKHLVNVSSNWADGATHPSPLFSAPATTNSPPCVNSITSPYTAFGALANATYGAGLTLTRAYDARLRLTCENDVGSNTGPTSGTTTVTITGAEQTKQ